MQVARIGGTKLIFNNLFLVLLFLWGVLGLLPYALLTFSIILLHELAHVLTAKHYGLAVKNIELFPFGGVARLDGLMEVNSMVETRIAIAGPLSNLLLIVLTFWLRALGVIKGDFSLFFIQGNLLLALFNLLPALPLDGGRIFRAFLAGRIGYRKATERAAALGRVLALFLLLLGIGGLALGWKTYSLLILGPFIYCAASREREMAGYAFICHLAKKKGDLGRLGVLPTEQLVVLEDTKLGEVIKHFLPQKYHLIFLLDDNLALRGIVTESEIIKGLMEQGVNLPIGKLLKHPFNK